jgi:hypothetical protein
VSRARPSAEVGCSGTKRYVPLMRHVRNRWVTADGRWVIDVIRLSATGTNRDGTWLRVRYCGFLAGEVRRWEDLGQFPFDVSDLRGELMQRSLPGVVRVPAKQVVDRGGARGHLLRLRGREGDVRPRSQTAGVAPLPCRWPVPGQHAPQARTAPQSGGRRRRPVDRYPYPPDFWHAASCLDRTRSCLSFPGQDPGASRVPAGPGLRRR